MSEQAHAARAAMKAKIKRLTEGEGEKNVKVDASDWNPDQTFDGTEKTGKKPINPRAFKRGGKVKGEPVKYHAGKRPRHSDEAMDRKLVDKMVKPSARTGKKDGGGNWIQGAIKHPGALHKALHVPKGEKIPEKKLEKAEHSSNPHLAKKARLAETLKSFHHAKGGKVHHPADCKCEHCTGGRAKKWGGGGAGMMHGNMGMPPAGGMGINPGAGMGRPPMGAPAPMPGGNPIVASGVGPNIYGGGINPAAGMGGGSLSPTGFKRGGAPKANYEGGTKPDGGRIARKSGGRAKTQINIVIAGKDKDQSPAPGGVVRPPVPVNVPPPGAGGPPGMPVPMGAGPGGPPGMPPGAGGPPGMPPMPRKRGGRAYPIESGGGGGEGRLEKAKAYGLKQGK